MHIAFVFYFLEALPEMVQFVWRSHVRVKDARQPVYVWVPDGLMRKLLQEFQKRALGEKD